MRSPSHPPRDPYNNELLLDYLEGLVDSGTRDRIETHLQDNEFEQDRFDGLRQLYEEYNGDREEVINYLEQARSKAFAVFQNQGETAQSSDSSPTQLKESKEVINSKPLYPKWLPLGIAASLTVIVVTYFLFNWSNSPTELAIAWSQEPYPVPEVVRGLSTVPTENWVGAYKNGQYAKAAQLLEAELAQNSTSKAGQYFFAGVSNLYPPSPNLDKAIQYLTLAQDSEPAYEEQARWYLTLAYLQNEQAEQARTVLKEIVSTQGYQSSRAQQLLDRLH